MSEQPGAETAAPEAPATLEQVLRSVQALTAPLSAFSPCGFYSADSPPDIL
eukprot:SAG31_NODE_2335_length_5925_cov_3.925506_2_plen_51_part_00